MTKAELLSFMREHSLVVQASVSAAGGAQAAVVGIVVTDDLEVFFDTVDTNRKVDNLRRNPKIAFVIGGTTGGDERTVQYEGIADEPTGAELRRLKELYFDSFPDGRERQTWPGLTYIRTRPTWVRYSDFNQDPPEVAEFDLMKLGSADWLPLSLSRFATNRDSYAFWDERVNACRGQRLVRSRWRTVDARSGMVAAVVGSTLERSEELTEAPREKSE